MKNVSVDILSRTSRNQKRKKHHAKAQRREEYAKNFLCAAFAALRLCVRFFCFFCTDFTLKKLKGKIVEFCQRRKITEFALFGSVLREDFRPDSDIDVVVTFAPEARYSLYDLVAIQDELRVIFGREVDLVEKAALRNPFRRREILKNMEIVYAT